MGRPKIEGLVSLNLRVLQEQLDALDVIVASERSRRGDPAFNRTDAIREAVAEWIARRVK
jgi:hypothetical protein